MPLVGTYEEAQKTRIYTPGYPTHKSDFLSDAAPRGTQRGNMKLVEQDPNSTLPAHFHYVNQFQVIVAGGGRFGRHEMQPISIQYAGAGTQYGPLLAGAEGMSYLVLRNLIDPGLAILPQDREKQGGRPRRQVVAEACPPLSDAQRIALEDTRMVSLIPAEADGLAASMLQMPGDIRTALPPPASGGGQFLVLISGELIHLGKCYDRMMCIYVSAEEDALDLTSGPSGAEAIFLQFPKG